MNETEPVSAGSVLKNKFMIPLGISGAQLARELGVSEAIVSKILHDSRKLSTDMAIRLSKFFRTSVLYWLNIGLGDEIERALAEKGGEYSLIVPCEKMRDKIVTDRDPPFSPVTEKPTIVKEKGKILQKQKKT